MPGLAGSTLNETWAGDEPLTAMTAVALPGWVSYGICPLICPFYGECDESSKLGCGKTNFCYQPRFRAMLLDHHPFHNDVRVHYHGIDHLESRISRSSWVLSDFCLFVLLRNASTRAHQSAQSLFSA